MSVTSPSKKIRELIRVTERFDSCYACVSIPELEAVLKALEKAKYDAYQDAMMVVSKMGSKQSKEQTIEILRSKRDAS
jgi:hypothetical protein